jgi:hypothetical protein
MAALARAYFSLTLTKEEKTEILKDGIMNEHIETIIILPNFF